MADGVPSRCAGRGNNPTTRLMRGVGDPRHALVQLLPKAPKKSQKIVDESFDGEYKRILEKLSKHFATFRKHPQGSTWSSTTCSA